MKYWVISYFDDRVWDTKTVFSSHIPEHYFCGPFEFESEANANH